ncbi:MAG: M3 family oligoendopeptidase [Clostridiaceae bacterium]|nr:M3 family oligoendopeptidase [Clostridiaceae bacterium]
MKVSEIQYVRLDVPACIKTVEEYTKRLKNAGSSQEAENILLDYTVIERELATTLAISSIRSTQNTADEFYEGEEQYYAETMPALMEKLNLMYKIMLESPYRPQMEKRFGKVAFTNAEISLKTISPEILSMLHEESLLSIEYQKLQGSLTVEFRGETYPLTKMGKFKTSEDRATRKEAYEAEGKAFLSKAEQYDDIYDRMVSIRTKIAQTLGYVNYTPLGYLRMTRNSYNPEMVRNFREQVKNDVVPLVAKLKEQQAKRLGIDHITLYDDAVMTSEGNPKPVIEDEELYKAGLSLYREMNPSTAEMINKMDSMGAFDLYSRENKMTGGYCSTLPKYKTPFIFANFNGTAGDVEVFTHEGGHAFAASLMLKNDEMLGLSEPTLESCEVHSMSMEFLSWPYLERFYGENTEKAKLIHLIGALEFLPYGCMVDEFQHIIYNNPHLTPQQRHEKWAALEKQYRPYIDFESMPFYSAGRTWQRQLHIYTNPFYYIDYCLAQTVALEIMEIMTSEGWQSAWERYMAYTSQGGSDTFVGMLEKAGLRVPFKNGALSGSVKAAEDYISKHVSILK